MIVMDKLLALNDFWDLKKKIAEIYQRNIRQW